ncbi:hypothetical protein [Actinomadura madurae]|uniref:Uncharacterized protein n=1 Tax=Actinomadura madurae TaxID=1993 RepID=A0A1I5IZ13_9ACTN|nr:hypothetical protein [Actinomadura madurae]SFO65824.1 hypothetical protein SAMN04489713_108186 [Actinomadura madurae]SPT58535.1 Uncharacterised protein [Actinomadura madurae]
MTIKHEIAQLSHVEPLRPGRPRAGALPGVGVVRGAGLSWQAERAEGQAWGLKTSESFHTHGTPPVEYP